MHKPASMLLALMGVGIVAYSISLDGTSKQQPPTERTIEVARAPRAQPIIQPTPTVISLSRPEASARDRIDYQQAIVVPDDAVSLVREVQRELRRVGCYDREINGIWTTSSRMATQMFTERINAKLPIDKPDAVLLSLLQSQTGVVCGKSCPSGQAIDAGGRCIPAALLSTTAKSNSPEKADRLVTGSLSGPPSTPDGPVDEPDNFGATQRSPRQASAKPPKFWRFLVRSVDRALGLY